MDDYKWNEEFVSQKKQIRAHLLKGRTITQLEALNLYGCLRLSAVIYDLREEGLPIITEKYQVSPRKRVGRYYIEPKYLETYNNNNLNNK